MFLAILRHLAISGVGFLAWTVFLIAAAVDGGATLWILVLPVVISFLAFETWAADGVVTITLRHLPGYFVGFAVNVLGELFSNFGRINVLFRQSWSSWGIGRLLGCPRVDLGLNTAAFELGLIEGRRDGSHDGLIVVIAEKGILEIETWQDNKIEELTKCVYSRKIAIDFLTVDAPDDDQFQCRRVQTKVYAGPSKKSSHSPSTPTLTEEDVYAAKVQREFPKYVERKTEDVTWKSLYEKRVQKKQKKEEKKLKMLTAKLAKANSHQPTPAKQTKMIDVVHLPGRCRKVMVTTQSAVQVSKARKGVTTGSTRIQRVAPPPTATAIKNTLQAKKPTPLMSKCLKMAKNMRR